MAASAFKISLLLMGLSGITAQILLLRELLVSFLGNELTLGVILANWLILEAIGSFMVGKSVEKIQKRLEVFVLLQLVFAAALPLALYLSRVFKNVLLITPGEGLGFAPIFYSSFLILFPVSLSHGALFTYGAKIYGQFMGEDAASVGKVYVLETIGSILGGLLITFVLIRFLHAFQIAFTLSLVHVFISALLLWPRRTSPSSRLRSGLWSLSVLLTVLCAFVLLSPLAHQIHLSSIQSQWRGLNVIHHEDSIYGNITVTQRGEQITFYTDGIPSITTPVPDVASLEDLVHFSMLSHEKPESVLILSGGAGGMIHEVLKYPVKQVHYVELDPLLLTLIHQFPTPLTRSELSDPRVAIHYTDGRVFLKRTPERFDVVFIGLSAPQELQTNRLFSLEFFSMAKKKMNPEGILVLTLPGSLTYISPELRDLNGCIWDTLKRTFRLVKIIPGDTNLYLASDSDKLATLSTNDMMRRLEERKIKTSLFTRSYIEDRLHERWGQWFSRSMEKREVRINSDFRPIAVFFSLSYWNALFSPYLTAVFQWFERLSLKMTLSTAIIITAFLFLFFLRKPHASRLSLPFAILTSGFADILLDLAIIFTFQAVFGYLYHQIGLLITVFMLGVASSSFTITRRLGKMKKASLLFLLTELGFVAFSIVLPLVFTAPTLHGESPILSLLLYTLFLVMSFLCGTLVGLQFPLAIHLYLQTHRAQGTLGHTAGLLYGADLLGGFFGGLLAGILFLPILGLRETCFMVAIIKACSFVLVLLYTRVGK
jgi:spermidine synthase